MKKLALLAALAFTLPARAELVTYNFTGFVFNILEGSSWVAESSVDGRKVNKGDKLKGSFTYNTNTKLVSFEDRHEWSKLATYKQSNAGNVMSFSFEDSGLAFRFNYDTITTHAGTPDYIRFTTAQDKYRAEIEMGGNNALDGSVAIPSRLKPVSSYFVPPYLSLEDSTVMVNVQFTSMDLAAPVPEPSTYAMLLAGLAGVGFAARRRQARC
ncbi:PEP-CTERM sorting domain-containing protein [Pseudoduganella violacea]|uniref:Ice-binding protein C-terminal domain-containing protein n=1 Tax=Pseudoduganella violacea TaxID=1715466 RepID=A0A7W5B9R1_9BURK|nr:PEP-CTERM sorting domain-containing protein [Pseudoduganella violacea]MBB3119116.1 hypothetical protein [Pseudoduganella violacea]